MSFRVSTVSVLGIMPDTDLDDATLLPFHTDASAWVDGHLEGKCPGANLAAVEKYLTAHFAVRASEGTELLASARADVSERYAAPAEGEATRYIQTAAAFDPCGIVAEHFMRQRRVKWRVGAGFDKAGGP